MASSSSRDLPQDLVLCLDARDSDVYATQEPLEFWKEIAHAGDFAKGDFRFGIDEPLLDHWHRTFNDMAAAGISVPVPVEHTKDPEKRRGTVVAMDRRVNRRGVPSLFARVRFRDAEAAKLGRQQSGVSIFVPREAQDGSGRTYELPVQHVAITDYPVLTDLEPFQPVALSFVDPATGAARVVKVAADSPAPRGSAFDNALTRDAEARASGDRWALSLDFGSGGEAGDAAKRAKGQGVPPESPDKPSVPVTQPAQNPRASQEMTLRDLASQLGVDPSVTDEQQLLQQVAAVVAQLKARAMAPQPPGMYPGQQPPHPGALTVPVPPRPGAPPMMPLAPQQMAPPPATYPAPQPQYQQNGPPAQRTGRPPIAASTTAYVSLAYDEGRHPRDRRGEWTAQHGAEVAPALERVGWERDPHAAEWSHPDHGPGHSLRSAYEKTASPENPHRGERMIVREAKRRVDRAQADRARVDSRRVRISSAATEKEVHEALGHAAAQAKTDEELAGYARHAHNKLKTLREKPGGAGFSLDGIPEEVYMALSKKQMKKLVKVVKSGKRDGGGKRARVEVRGDKSRVQELNDESHFGDDCSWEDDGDDTYKDEGNDAFDSGEDNDGDDGAFDPEGSGKLSRARTRPVGPLALSGSLLDMVRKTRQTQLDQLFRSRHLTAHARKDAEERFVRGQGVAFSHEYDDGFDWFVKTLLANGPVLPGGRSGPQVDRGAVVALSDGGQEENPLMADVQRRIDGKTNFAPN